MACIPAHNEEATIAKVIVETMSHVNQVIVCDDGSQDSTAKIAEKLGAVVISHTRNHGYGASLASLFEKAREMQADIMVTLDGDGQHNPTDIQSLIQPLIDSQADIVIGSRFLPQAEKNVDRTSSYRRFGIKTITRISNAVSQSKLTDSQSGYRAYHKKAINAIQITEQGMGVSTEIIFKAQMQNLRIVEVPIAITYGENTSGQNSMSHGVDVVISTLKFVSIEHPLRFYGIPGLAALVLSGFFILWTLQIYSVEGRIVTNIALLGIGFLIIGIVLMTTSVLLYVIINVVRETRRVH